MLRKPTVPTSRDSAHRARAQRLCYEFVVGTCYVAVGGYGWVEIVVRLAGWHTGTPVAMAIPAHTAATPAECLLQPDDGLVIRYAGGVIAEIPVQTIVDHQSFAGFHVLNAGPAAVVPGATDRMRAFEQFLADVPTRGLISNERWERNAGARH
jgi:hypothetical protein